MMRLRALPFSVAVLLAALSVTMTLAQVHDVPGRKQSRPDNCGPTAVTACIGWFQNHGFPDIRTSDGKAGLDDIQRQLDADSRNGHDKDDHERTVDELVRGIDLLISQNGKGAYRKRLKSGVPGQTDLKNFGWLDGEFAHGEDIILLLRFGPNNQGHYVTVRDITTDASGNRTIEYMDPATGQNASATVTASGAKLRLKYAGKDGFIENAVTLSPTNYTETSKPAPVDRNDRSKGTKITYTVGFPIHRVPRDLHILTKDCDVSHYTVTGLPEGWTVTVQRVGTKCYLTFNRGNATAELAPGQQIEVVYKGKKTYVSSNNGIVQTADGSLTLERPLIENGGYLLADSRVLPRAPGGVVAALTESAPGRLGVGLRWNAVSNAASYRSA